MPSTHEPLVPGFDTIISDDSRPFAIAINESPQPAALDIDQFDIGRRVIQEQPVQVNKKLKHSRNGEEPDIIPLEKKVKKRKRNEIDDIFGF